MNGRRGLSHAVAKPLSILSRRTTAVFAIGVISIIITLVHLIPEERWARIQNDWNRWSYRPHRELDPDYFCGISDTEPTTTNFTSASRTHDGEGSKGQWRTCSDFPRPSFGTDDVFAEPERACMTYESRYDMTDSQSTRSNGQIATVWNESASTRGRTAVVLRAWDGFSWTADDMLHLRSLVAEVQTLSQHGYDIHILVHVKSGPKAGLRSADILRSVGLQSVPDEFKDIAEFWTYEDCREMYPAVGEYDVYYHTFMALQIFAERHPEYEYLWNWEMDVRYTGLYDRLFPSLSDWARSEAGVWQRNTQFYMEGYYGTWDNYTYASAPGSHFSTPEPWTKTIPQTSPSSEADLITLFPMFNVTDTFWPHKDYLVGYSADDVPSRFGTVGTNMRLSRSLLNLMAAENKLGRSMMSEMWPPTLAFHHGMKTVYVPHPVFMQYKWAGTELEQNYWRVGGHWNSVVNHEEDFLGVTWFWNAEWPRALYERWMGVVKEGAGSEEWRGKHGPLCLPSMLLHPVKGAKLVGMA